MNAKPAKRKQPKQESLATPSHQTGRRGPWLLAGGVIIVLGVGLVIGLKQLTGESETPEIPFEVVAEFPHDELAYTQGLFYHAGNLYESTGRYGESSLRKVNISTGEIEQQVDLDSDLFGEGLCLWGDQWLQLTWRSELVLHYDRDSFEEIKRTPWGRQGWGLTHDGTHLIISDGTSRLFFLEPDTFEVDRKLDVQLDGDLLDRINELEYIDGYIYANVWYKPFIVKIDPSSGQVKGKINLQPVMEELGLRNRDAVLNGIAYNPSSQSLYVTGKLWPKLFEIKLTGSK